MVGPGRGGGDRRRNGVFAHSPILACRERLPTVEMAIPDSHHEPSFTHTSVRSIRRSVRRSALKEYIGAALWVLPSLAAPLALALGYGMSQIEVAPGSPLNRLAFQGTAADARELLSQSAARS